jgi:hypothetical protein
MTMRLLKEEPVQAVSAKHAKGGFPLVVGQPADVERGELKNSRAAETTVGGDHR